MNRRFFKPEEKNKEQHKKHFNEKKRRENPNNTKWLLA